MEKMVTRKKERGLTTRNEEQRIMTVHLHFWGGKLLEGKQSVYWLLQEDLEVEKGEKNQNFMRKMKKKNAAMKT